MQDIDVSIRQYSQGAQDLDGGMVWVFAWLFGTFVRKEEQGGVNVSMS